jgi:BirA family biotin operon repressor/biotin-[acetyl-CoA-carboxylase] ligase
MHRTPSIGQVLIELTETDSTNNYAMHLLSEGMADHGIAVRTDLQRKGKGQHGNHWVSEEGKNLLFSYVLHTAAFPISRQFMLNIAACVSVADFLIHDLQMSNISIKWPNDIYADNRKMAGILIENVLRGSSWHHAVVGIGLNVNQDVFPDDVLASSVFLETRQHYLVKQILQDLLVHVNRNYQLFIEDDDELLKRYNKLLYRREKEIEFSLGERILTGRITAVGRDGRISIISGGETQMYRHKEIGFV